MKTFETTTKLADLLDKDEFFVIRVYRPGYSLTCYVENTSPDGATTTIDAYEAIAFEDRESAEKAAEQAQRHLSRHMSCELKVVRMSTDGREGEG
jgi:hypothetical protein